MREKILYDASILKRNKPVNFITGDEHIFRHEFERQVSASYINRFKNVHLTYEGIILKNYLLLSDAPLFLKSEFNKYKYRYSLSVLLKRKEIQLPKNKIYIAAFDRESSSYFHFFADFLTRLIEVKDQLKSCTLILPDYFKYGIISEIVNSFEINEILYINPNEYFKVSDLIVPDYIALSGNYKAENLHKLQKHLINYFQPKNNFSDKNYYYISREKAAWRHLTNEKEVTLLLGQYGIQKLFFEDFSFREQLEIAFNMQIMISSHGANLTNCLFMQSGGKILEFRKKNDTHNHCYYSLASSINLQYFYQHCDFIDRQIGNYFDLCVDLHELEKNLKLMI